jgi:glycosyltransferase involved in cell wall biosynthesis
MKFSVVMPNYNGARFLDEAIRSVLYQTCLGVEVELLVMDGGSTDGSLAILDRYQGQIAKLVSERDHGPASAINKGLRLATGEMLAWLNADDRYQPGALLRVAETMARHPKKALGFGHCSIVNEDGREIRAPITRFKEIFFPLSSRFTIQSINFISQPAMFFSRAAYGKAGGLREDLRYAWDYDFILRLWRAGGGVYVPGPALADFRWHPGSLSGQGFVAQFQEELDAATADAGRFSPQALMHRMVRRGIVSIYSLMAHQRQRAGQTQNASPPIQPARPDHPDTP